MLAGEVSCTYQDDANKSWSVDVNISGLSDGQIAVEVALKDLVENLSAPLEHSFERDITPPTLTLNDNPINGVNQGSYSLSGTCGEEGGEVSVTLAGSVLGGTVSCSQGAWEKTGIDAETLVTSSLVREVALVLTHRDGLGNEALIEQKVVRDIGAPFPLGPMLVPGPRTYKEGHMDFSLAYNEQLVVTGNPRLVLTVGIETRYADYRALENRGRRVGFRYVILSGHEDLDGIELSATLDFNGGSITDGAGNSVPTTLTVPLLSGVFVNSDIPALNSVTGAADIYKSGDTVTLTAVFGQAVVVIGSPQLVLSVGGIAGAAVYSDDGSLKTNHTFTYTVGNTENDSDGIEVTGINFNGGSIQNNAAPANLVLEFLGRPLLLTEVKVDALVPVLTDLSNDPVVATSKTWSWGCTDDPPPCEYRYAVNTSATHSFSAESWGTDITTTKDAETGTYYLHIQVKDSAGNESAVQSFSAILDNTGPVQLGSIVVPTAKTYRRGETLSFQLSFDEPVVVNTINGIPLLVLTLGSSTKHATYTGGNESSTLTFEFTVAEGEEDHNGLSGGIAVELNGGAISDGLGNGVSAETLGALNIEEMFGVLINGTSSTLSGVTGTVGTYITGAEVDLTAVFSESVTVSSSSTGVFPRLILDVGGSGSPLYADYQGSTGASGASHTFRYTVSAGESDGDGIQVTGIDLQGGSLLNAAGNGFITASAALDVAGVLVEAIAPVLTDLSNDPVVATSKTWSWGCTDDSLSCEYLYAVNTSATHSFGAESWGTDITTTKDTETGTYYLHIQAKDSVGNESAVQSFLAILDNTGPVQQGSIVVPTDRTYKQGETLTFQLIFDEPVLVSTISGTPHLVLTLGSGTKHADYTGGSGSSTLTFGFTVAGGETDHDGLSGGTVVELNGGTFSDELGNEVLSGTLTSLVTGDISRVMIDGVSLALISVEGTANIYGTGENVDLTAHFNNSVTVSPITGNSPRLILDVGGSTLHATYTGDGALGTTHTFLYTVSAGESDGDGIQITGFDLRGGSIQDSGSNSVDFPGQPLDVSEVLVDTLPPSLTDLSDDLVAATSKIWSWGCTDISTPCEYRYFIDTNTGHSFTGSDTYSSTAITATQSEGTGTYYLHVQAKDSLGNESVVQSFSAVLDNTSPVQAYAVTAPAAKTYKLGDTLSFELSFNESVVVDTASGTPRLVFTLGGSSKYADYTGGSGSATLSFGFTVEAGEEDRDGLTGGDVMELNGGSLSDGPGNAVSESTLGALQNSDFSSVLVDGVRPVFTGLSDDLVKAVSKTWSWGCTDNSLPCQYRYKVNTSLSHTFLETDTWGDTATATHSLGSGTYYLHVQARDSVGSESLVKSYSVVLDNDSPAIARVALPDSKVYLEGDSMNFIVHYDDHVYVKAQMGEAKPVLVLDINGVSRNAEYTGITYAAHSDVLVDTLGKDLTFSYVVQSGDEDADGVTLSSLSAGQVLGAFERAAFRTLPPGLNSSGVKVDAVRPTITGLLDDPNPSSAKVWTWACEDEFLCEYRYAVNTEITHTFNGETWTSLTTVTEASGTGTYYLHIQARDTAGLLSDVLHVSAVVDVLAPALTGGIEVPADSTYSQGALLDFVLNYDDDVVVGGDTFFAPAYWK